VSRILAKVRRYTTGNRLNRYAVLSFGDYHSVAEASDEAARLVRRLRAGQPCPFPYLVVVEGHHGERPHLNLLVPSSVTAEVIRASWSKGEVTVRDLPNVGSIRRVAGYVVKQAPDMPPGSQAYRVGQGFKPEYVQVTVANLPMAHVAAATVAGRPPQRTWSSSEIENWEGPPAGGGSWDDRVCLRNDAFADVTPYRAPCRRPTPTPAAEPAEGRSTAFPVPEGPPPSPPPLAPVAAER